MSYYLVNFICLRGARLGVVDVLVSFTVMWVTGIVGYITITTI